MTDYDFKTLNDKEFEVLATDLLSKRDNVTYERFKPGRDGGVDGRYFSTNGNEVILQCKHWISSPLEKLIKKISQEEILKIKRLNPEKYILVLSHSLSRNDKNVIQTALSPYIKSPSDILGKEDLNDILSLHEDIEKKHFKLWITSSNVLSILINKPIYDRSASLLEDIRSNAHMYVKTSNHADALKKLEALGTIIITGPAGIGKTTLAEQLLLYYSALGYSLHSISEEIKEAESVLNPEKNQIFYFDDFLGRNYLEALSGHEGSHIVNFIKRIKKDKNKRFILTSRTTILNQGKILNDEFHNNNIQRNEYEISFDSFSELDKAKILYNHIWHSSLSEDFIDQLYYKKRYKEIIQHRNFNPRIIKFITDSSRLNQCSVENYWLYSKSLLENPADVWSNSFEAQHDDFGRALILLITLNSRDTSEQDLAEAFTRFISTPYAASMHGKKDFIQQIRHLAGSMLNRITTQNNVVLINLFNPSIGDYVLKRYSHDVPALRAAFLCLRSTSSLNTIINMEANKLISNDVKNNLFDAIIDNSISIKHVSYSDTYIGLLVFSRYKNINDPSIREIIESVSMVTMASEDYPKIIYSLKLANWRLKEKISSHLEISSYLFRYMDAVIDFEEAELIASMIEELPEKLQYDLLTKLEDGVTEYLADEVESEFSEANVFDNVTPNDLYSAKDNLRELIEEKFRTINIEVSEINIDKIIESYNFENRAADYFGYYDDLSYEKREHIQIVPYNNIDAIDDLFERN